MVELKLKLNWEVSFTIAITYIETEEKQRKEYKYRHTDRYKKVIKTKIWVLRREEFRRWVYDLVRFGEEDWEKWRGWFLKICKRNKQDLAYDLVIIFLIFLFCPLTRLFFAFLVSVFEQFAKVALM